MKQVNRSFFLPVVFLCCAAGTSLSFAQDIDEQLIGEYNQRLNALENKWNNVHSVINPSAGPKPGFYLSGAVLYLQARENGLDYGVVTNPQIFTESVKNHLTAPDFDWNFGFRVGAGFNFKRDGWYLGSNWFHLETDAVDRQLLRGEKALFPVWTAQFLLPFPNFFFARNSSAHLDIKIDLVDVELGRAFYVSKHLVLKPYGGLIGARIDQDYKIEYDEIPSISNVLSDHHKMENDFEGGGLVAGANSRWLLGSGFSIYGDAQGALMYGKFHLSHKEFLTLTQGAPIDFQLKKEMHLTRALANCALGLRWESPLSNTHFHAAFQIGYEFFLFFGQNQLYRFVDNQRPGAVISNQGDLTLQGGVFSAQFDF